jgi:hypothetical protein
MSWQQYIVIRLLRAGFPCTSGEDFVAAKDIMIRMIPEGRIRLTMPGVECDDLSPEGAVSRILEQHGRCPHCGFPLDKDNYCSLFCLEATGQELIELKSLKEGEWGIFPCAECGGPLEAEFGVDVICAPCAPRRRLRVRTALLHKVLDIYGTRVSETQAEIDLLHEIQGELK